MTVVKDATESVANLSGKKKKTRLKVRDQLMSVEPVGPRDGIYSCVNVLVSYISIN